MKERSALYVHNNVHDSLSRRVQLTHVTRRVWKAPSILTS